MKPPLVCMKTFRVRIYWSTEAFIYKFFRHCETMKFQWRKVIYTSYEEKFRYPGFLKQWMAQPWNISALWDKRFWTENRDIPFWLKKLSIPESFWCIELFPNKIFRFCETNKFERKVVIAPLSDKIKKFFDIFNFLKLWKVPPRNFLALSDKKFLTKNRFTLPPLSLIHNFLHTTKLLKNRKDPLRCFSVRWD